MATIVSISNLTETCASGSTALHIDLEMGAGKTRPTRIVCGIVIEPE
jgi:hypothetical protein